MSYIAVLRVLLCIDVFLDALSDSFDVENDFVP
jgi:hypothetical protein